MSIGIAFHHYTENRHFKASKVDKLTHHGQMIVVIFNYFMSSCLNHIIQLQLSTICHPVRHLTSRAGRKGHCNAFLNHVKCINMQVAMPLKIKVRGEKDGIQKS